MIESRRPLYWVIGLLVLLNLTTLGVIWTVQAPGPPRRDGAAPPDPQAVTSFLQKELGLSEEQARRLTELRQRHAEQIQRLRSEIGNLKREQLEAQLTSVTPDTARATQTARAIAERQFRLELSTFQHFADLKGLCRDDQAARLRALLPELLGEPQRPGAAAAPAPPPPPRDQGPPPRG